MRLEEHNRAQRRYFEDREKRRMLPTGSPYLRRHVEELVRFASLDPPARLLEIGSGMGRYTFLFAERGFEVEALDLSPVLLERLQRFDGGRFGIRVHAADVAEPPPNLLGRFDAVLGLFTLHHLHDLDRCFAALAKLVRPGGRVVFLEPNPLNPLYYVQIAATPGMTWQGDGGIIRMRPAVVFGAMDVAGLRRLRLRRFGFFPPFVANRGWAPGLEARLERVRSLRRVLPFQLFAGERPA
jgi:SAM-dependent methyltransferase